MTEHVAHLFSRRNLRIASVIVCLVLPFWGFTAAAQTYTMSNSVVTTCGGTFTDSGGLGSNYGNSQTITMTFCSGDPSVSLEFVFTQFAVELGFDELFVYDGPSAAAPLIGVYSGNGLGSSPGTVVSSGECITFRFESDLTVTLAGWAATVNCVASQGCTDAAAYNYDPNASADDGSCIYDCFSGPIYNEVICYGNSASVTYFFPPIAGQDLILQFLDGSVESSTFDQLTVYEGQGTAGAVLYSNPLGTTALGGITLFSSAGNGFTLTIVSDESISCGSGSYNPIVVNVVCGEFGCTDPAAPNYDPDAFIDDGSCLPCFFSEANGCPNIDAGEDVVLIECPDPCTIVTLEADFLELGSTTDYSVCAIDYNPYPFGIGTAFSLGTDDIWSGVISLPFEFCFYGNVFDQIVVGSNGVVTFDLNQADACCAWSYTATCPTPLGTAPDGTAPDCLGVGALTGLYNNSIMGVYHDIDPSPMNCGSITYSIIGTVPCRRFVVSYNDVCHFSCNSIRTSSQIILYETTNVIEVFVQDKPLCPNWNGGRAVIGVQNANGTVGVSPAGRNTGQWTAANEGWRFLPSGASVVEVNWYAQGQQLVGTGATLDVCPTDASQTFAAEAVYTRCDGQEIVVEDFVTVTCLEVLLPVEWLSFDAKLSADERQVDCTWSTASETNNDYFTIERSPDNAEWQAIGSVPGGGTSSTQLDYHFVDRNPLNGISYYRVRQTDYNGQSDLSEVRVVNRELSGEGFTVYPNPGNGHFILTGYRAGDFSVYNAAGQRVPFGLTMAGELTLHTASAGVYILELLRGEAQLPERIRLVVQ